MFGYKKRNRLPNFTSAEENFLLKLAQQHIKVVECKITDGPTWEMKRKVWAKIDSEFAKKFGLRRGSKNLREKYVNIKRKLRRSMSGVKEEASAEYKSIVDESPERLAALARFSAVGNTEDADSDAINTFCTDHNAFDETAQSCSLDDPIQESESGEYEHSNKELSWNSAPSIEGRNVRSIFHSWERKNKDTSIEPKHIFCENEELRSAEKHRWEAERFKREAELHKWELEKQKWLVEKQKLELNEAKLKMHILELKLKHSPIGKSSESSANIAAIQIGTEPVEEFLNSSGAHEGKETDSHTAVSTLSSQIKLEPTLDISDTPANSYSVTSNEDRLFNITRGHKRTANFESPIDPIDFNEEQHHKNDMLDNSDAKNNSIDSSCDDIPLLVNEEFDSEINNEDDDDASISLNKKNSTDDFLNLLTKYNLQHYFLKLRAVNVGLDCMKAIREVDLRDIFGCDIGARIRFRGLVQDWRVSNLNFNHLSNHQKELNEIVTKKDIAELKSLIKSSPKTFYTEQQKVGNYLNQEAHEDINPVNVIYKEILPEKPFHTVSEFKAFEKLISDSAEAYKNLVNEFTAQKSNHTVAFIKSSWRRIMTDNVAKHFCWTGTPEKPAIRTLRVTDALKEAYRRKYNYGSNEEFQRIIISFFQHAKTRLQKKQNYEKTKAPCLPL
ncbi:uncharacterized protein LOC128863769 isoform X1 [Anastrepha ludens]|uniref:uncharacterized protein LOC128863769 isoform X1 n=1 Tax=Anastrepha ludens TaxID=28586 RepID=UPI0023B0D6F1|nr:uncharacterized protein LOC128863769 isoform X1 [Anastrepha ludens]